jgi:hypothetical protein
MEKYNNFSLQEGTLVTRTDTISSDHYLQLTADWHSGQWLACRNARVSPAPRSLQSSTDRYPRRDLRVCCLHLNICAGAAFEGPKSRMRLRSRTLPTTVLVVCWVIVLVVPPYSVPFQLTVLES